MSSHRIWAFSLLGAIAVGATLLVMASPDLAADKSKKPAGDSKEKGDSSAKEDPASKKSGGTSDDEAPKKVVKTDAEWRKQLTPLQFRVTRKKGTEPAGTGKYAHSKKDGIYRCVCCGQPLFDSKTKFESGTGWPSFFQPLGDKAVNYLDDNSAGELRTEVECSRCDAHLGHVFGDGPAPTGQRYCMNSASLDFMTREAFEKEQKTKHAKSKSSGGEKDTKGSEAKEK